MTIFNDFKNMSIIHTGGIQPLLESGLPNSNAFVNSCWDVSALNCYAGNVGGGETYTTESFQLNSTQPGTVVLTRNGYTVKLVKWLHEDHSWQIAAFSPENKSISLDEFYAHTGVVRIRGNKKGEFDVYSDAVAAKKAKEKYNAGKNGGAVGVDNVGGQNGIPGQQGTNGVSGVGGIGGVSWGTLQLEKATPEAMRLAIQTLENDYNSLSNAFKNQRENQGSVRNGADAGANLLFYFNTNAPDTVQRSLDIEKFKLDLIKRAAAGNLTYKEYCNELITFYEKTGDESKVAEIKHLQQQANLDDKVSFEEAFYNLRGVVFSNDAVMEYSRQKTTADFYTAMNNAVAVIHSLGEQYNEESGSRDRMSNTQFEILRTALNRAFSGDINKAKKFLMENFSTRGIELHYNDKGEIDFFNPTNLKSKQVWGKEILEKLFEFCQSNYKKALNGKTLEDYTAPVKDAYKSAYGKVNIGTIVGDYMKSQENVVAKTKMLAQGVGFVMVIAGTVVPVLAVPGILLSTYGGVAVDAAENYTKAGGPTPEDIKEMQDEFLKATALTAAGVGSGAAAARCALSAADLATTCPTLIKWVTEIGVDATLSSLSQRVIVGEFDFQGEGVSQVINLLTGIVASKTHTKPKFGLDGESSAHVGNNTTTASAQPNAPRTELAPQRPRTAQPSPTNAPHNPHTLRPEMTNSPQRTSTTQPRALRSEAPSPEFGLNSPQTNYSNPIMTIDYELELGDMDITILSGEELVDLVKTFHFDVSKMSLDYTWDLSNCKDFMEMIYSIDSKIAKVKNPDLKKRIQILQGQTNPSVKELDEICKLINADSELQGLQSAYIMDKPYNAESFAAEYMKILPQNRSVEFGASSLHGRYLPEVINPATVTKDFDWITHSATCLEYIKANPDSAMSKSLYKDYLGFLQQQGVPENLITHCRKIESEYGVRVFMSSDLKEASEVLSYLELELNEWKMASNGGVKFPPTIDFNSIKREYLPEGNHLTGGMSGGFSESNYSGAVSINGQTVDDLRHAIRHEITHTNDSKLGYNIPDKYDLSKIMPKKTIMRNGEKVEVPDMEHAPYVQEFRNAGITDPKVIEYAYNNTKEFIAVASEGDMSKYSPEFKQMLIDFGMPEWMFYMSPKEVLGRRPKVVRIPIDENKIPELEPIPELEELEIEPINLEEEFSIESNEENNPWINFENQYNNWQNQWEQW